ncbi:hypothetical protein [Turicibacter sanguinis]|uniref:hypothetical protein n=2 Tax=Turicibacter sanguinis TaxID=154288 RepID=UPI001E3DA40A|nr:hypothetical protein [Turicibacter sanguinis]MDB8564365.1 hypothetical protein [Turicibacter sanguinis]
MDKGMLWMAQEMMDKWIEEIQEELKNIDKIKLGECSKLIQEFVSHCLMSKSGMLFLESDAFKSRVADGTLTRQMWEEFEDDLVKYGDLLDRCIEVYGDFDSLLVDDDLDCAIICYLAFPYYFNN